MPGVSANSSNSRAVSSAAVNRLSLSFLRLAKVPCWALKDSASVPRLAGVSVMARPTR
ncbi:hypothetical protein D3C86_1942670 [compost metagenome]